MQVLSNKKFEHYSSLLDLDFSFVDDPRAFRSEKQEELGSLMNLLVMGFSCKKRILREVETHSKVLKKANNGPFLAQDSWCGQLDCQ